MSEWYEEQQAALRDEQASQTKEDVLEQMQQQSEYSVDLDNLPKQTHHFVKRGIVVSCEGANHPSHRHFLAGRGTK